MFPDAPAIIQRTDKDDVVVYVGDAMWNRALAEILEDKLHARIGRTRFVVVEHEQKKSATSVATQVTRLLKVTIKIKEKFCRLGTE